MRLLILPLACAAMISASPCPAQPRPVVATDAGQVRGTTARGVEAFKGIPFAAPPIGQLRWRAPQPPAAWNGVRDAAAYGHDCMQKPFPSDAAPLGTAPAEDCLTANVWRPTGARGLPVLLWIYGGGFVNGGSSPPTYAGAAMARKGVIFVSFNYRLGRFGTFAHPALTKAKADGGLLANYGTMDQIAALRWVRRNVAAFGGDPDRVTIVGESAGGFSVHALMTSPAAGGLFRGAVIQSGGLSEDEHAPTLADAEAKGLAFARSKGIAGDDAAALVALRALPAERVVDGLNLETFQQPAAVATYSRPIADGRVAVDPLTAYRAGRFTHVPVMLGATSDDIGGTTGYMATGARRMADLLAGAGVTTWRYRFSYVATSARTPETKGAAHATEIPFFFDTAEVKYGGAASASDHRAASLASDYLAAFVRDGDPAGTGRPAWPRYRTRGALLLDLDAGGGATTIPAD